jgi:hypothetical protein
LSRLPQIALVLLLLGATAAAFAVTERLKLERSPITGTRVDKVFSPVCECARNVAVISFRLRKPERVTVTMIDSAGRSVQTLVRGRREQVGRVSYTWDGRDDAGRVVPEGRYRARVELAAHGRTIVLPNPIRVDTTDPTIRLVRVSPRVISPDGDGRGDSVTASYKVDERARALMLIDDKRRVLGRFSRLQGRLVWYGRVNGRPVPPGNYALRLRAIDRAGNRSTVTREIPLRVRYIELARNGVVVVAGKRFKIGVSTDAKSYRWLLAGKRGVAHRRVLRLHAPDSPGSYTLYVSVGGHADKAAIVVSASP